MKVRTLLLADLRLITRDGIVFLAWLGPLALLAVLAVAIPISQRYIDLDPFLPWIAGLTSALIPYIPGVGVGFLLLDEIDHGLVRFYGVSPLGLRGYLLYRLGSAWLPAVIYLSLMPVLLPWMQVAPIEYALHVLAAALGAPLMGLALAVLAANRVEGLAVSKALGTVLAAPLLPYWLPAPWWWLAVVLPPYAVVHSVFRMMEASTARPATILYAAALHVFWIAFFLRQLRRKIW